MTTAADREKAAQQARQAQGKVVGISPDLQAVVGSKPGLTYDPSSAQPVDPSDLPVLFRRGGTTKKTRPKTIVTSGDADRGAGSGRWIEVRVPLEGHYPDWKKRGLAREYYPPGGGYWTTERKWVENNASRLPAGSSHDEIEEYEESTQDDVRKMSELQRDLFKMKEPELRALQDRLQRAGVLKKNGYTPGVPDEETVDAYTTMLRRAGNYMLAGNKVSFDEALDDAIRNYDPARDANGSPFSPVLSDPAELKNTVRKISTLVAGQYLPEHVLDQIVAEYRNMELGNQRSAYDAAAFGGTTTQTPNFQTFAENEIRERDPEASQATDLAARAEEFMSLLGGAD